MKINRDNALFAIFNYFAFWLSKNACLGLEIFDEDRTQYVINENDPFLYKKMGDSIERVPGGSVYYGGPDKEFERFVLIPDQTEARKLYLKPVRQGENIIRRTVPFYYDDNFAKPYENGKLDYGHMDDIYQNVRRRGEDDGKHIIYLSSDNIPIPKSVNDQMPIPAETTNRSYFYVPSTSSEQSAATDKTTDTTRSGVDDDKNVKIRLIASTQLRSPSTRVLAPFMSTPVPNDPLPSTPMPNYPLSPTPVPNYPLSPRPVPNYPLSPRPVSNDPLPPTPVSNDPLPPTPVSNDPLQPTSLVPDDPLPPTPVAVSFTLPTQSPPTPLLVPSTWTNIVRPVLTEKVDTLPLPARTDAIRNEANLRTPNNISDRDRANDKTDAADILIDTMVNVKPQIISDVTASETKPDNRADSSSSTSKNEKSTAIDGNDSSPPPGPPGINNQQQIGFLLFGVIGRKGRRGVGRGAGFVRGRGGVGRMRMNGNNVGLHFGRRSGRGRGAVRLSRFSTLWGYIRNRFGF